MHLKQISRDLRRKLYGSRADYRGTGYYGAGSHAGAGGGDGGGGYGVVLSCFIVSFFYSQIRFEVYNEFLPPL